MSEGNAATATKAAAPDPLLGRVIAGRFKIVSLLARGGMGKVYVAEQAPLGRVCALKVLNPNYNGDADPEFHRRFYREANISSRITHPNSVTIFDYGKTDDEIYYMAMELLEGQTLHQAIREAGSFPEERVGRISAQICRALREAHALEVIHRDLKPANIFLTRHGDGDDFVKILDFGLVKQLGERPEEQLTQTGLFMGSPKYMAPEQIQGGVVDPRTDIYSLGIMMYEMLTGKVPFERATSVNILMAHVGEPPPPMRQVNPNLVCSPMFEDLVMRCIAKDPNERYTTMDDVLYALKRAHGVSLTGQLAALTSGGWSPLGTIPPGTGSVPPPPYAPNAPGTAASALSSGMTAAMSTGPSQVGQVGQLSSSPPPPVRGTASSIPAASAAIDTSLELAQMRPRSKIWIPLGVLGAAVLGGVLGMVVFKVTAPPTRAQTQETARPAAGSGGARSGAMATVTSAAPDPPAGAAASAAPASPSASVASASPASLFITTEPTGATVREEGVEICAATPCEVMLRKTGSADPAKEHKLVVQRAGYRAELRTVRAGDPPVSIKLARAPASGVHAAPKGTDTPPNAAGPEGYKDVPY
jgi:serine/threonine-protein kinase